MSSREASLEELLKASVQSGLNNIYTAIPCIVVAVRDNLTTQLVDIQPTINQKQKDGTVKERSTILAVPVVFPESKTSAFTFPINVGDTGLAIFSMRSMDAWKSGSGMPATPQNYAKFDKSDAVFIPGLQTPSQAINNPSKRVLSHDTKDTVVVHNIGIATECELRLKADGSIRITTSNQPIVITGSDVTVNAETISLNANSMTVDVPNTTWIGNISHTGNYTMSGIATFNGIVFNTHRHTGVQTGSGTSAGPVN